MSIKYALISAALFCASLYPVTIMLDPAGDAKQAGRTIGDSFERTITLECAQAIKTILEQTSNYTVIITRMPGDAMTHTQKATFANRIMPSLYISIHAYHESGDKPTISIFHHTYDNTFITKSFDLAFIAADQAHRAQSAQTTHYAIELGELLSERNYHAICTMLGTYSCPFGPLTALQSPAIAIELGLTDSTAWRPLAEAIATALRALVVPA